MKTICGLAASHLLLLFTTLFCDVTAVPTLDSIKLGLHSTIQARAQVPTVPDIRNLASDLLAVQLIGAQTTASGIASLGTGPYDSRLAPEGYNVTAIRDVACQASGNGASPLPSIDELQSLVVQYSSWIWIYQAVGALKGDPHRLNILCHLIDVASSFGVGQNGTLVSSQICNVGNGGELPAVPLPFFTSTG